MVEKSVCLPGYRCHQGAWVAKGAAPLAKGQEHTGDLRRQMPLGES